MYYYESSVCHLMQMLHSDMCLWHFECSVTLWRRCEAFCILCVQFWELCVEFWKKGDSFENVCKQLEKTVKHTVLQWPKPYYTCSDAHRMWQGLQTNTDYKGKHSRELPSDTSLPDELNYVYARFEANNTEMAMFCYNRRPAQPEEDWPPLIAWLLSRFLPRFWPF